MERIKKFITTIFGIVIIALILPNDGFAQPNLPIAPSQAPIDGGLGLLTTAGGTCAYKT